MSDENLLNIAAGVEADNAARSGCETLRAERVAARAVESLANDIIVSTQAEVVQLRAELAAEQAAHQLTRETYETGARMNAAVNESLRARIKDVADAVDRFLVALRRDQDDDTRETYDEVADAKLALAAAVVKHECAGSDVVAELRADMGELCAAIGAERQRENDMGDGGGSAEWTRLQEAKAATDAIAERLAPEAVQDAN